jgi:hypothetical protein
MKKILILFFIFLNINLFAAVLPPTTTTVINNPSTGSSAAYNVQDPNYSSYSGTWYNQFSNVSVKNRIVFKIDRDEHRHYSSSGDIVINYTVDYETYSANTSGLTIGSQTKEIVLHYDTGYLAKEIDEITVVIDNVVSSEVTINSILYPSGVSYPAALGYPSINFENIIDIERIEKFNYNTTITPIQIIGVSNNSQGRPQFLRMSWSTLPYCVEAIELEYMFVNYYAGLSSIGTESYSYNQSLESITSYPYNFRNNATRVFLEGSFSSFDIPNLFPDGYIIFRVRPIGKNFNDPNEWLQGYWTMEDEGTLNLTSEVSASRAYLTTSPSRNASPAIDMNSMSVFMFSEGGKVISNLSYYDGTLRDRQSVVYVKSKGIYMVNQKIFDYLGREAVSVIPSVAMDELGYAFRTEYNLSENSGNSYNYTDFDYNETSSEELSVSSMKNTNGASKYFSSNLISWMNSLGSSLSDAERQMNSFTPDAEGYPFMQTEFTKDPTGRAIRTGGIGKQLQLKAFDENSNLVGGHELKVWDATPFQPELDVLFGNEVGYAEKYKKVMSQDQNGQLSVGYMDPYGRTIATALAGSSSDTSKYDPIASSNHSLNYFITLPNTFEDESSGIKKIKHHFLVTSKDTWRFYYQYELPTLNVPCDTSLCFTCGYTLTMSLQNTLGQELFPEGTPNQAFVGNPIPSSGSCDAVQKFTIDPNPIELVLEPGEYDLVKVLKIDESLKNQYKQLWLDSIKCLKTFDDFFDEEKEKMGLNCEMDCQECRTEQLKLVNVIDSLLDYCELNTIDTLGFDPLLAAKSEYREVVEICKDICMEKTACEILLDAIKLDLTPGGQYAKFSIPGWDGNDSLNVPDLQEGSIFQGVDPKWWCNDVWPTYVDYSYDIPVWKQPLNLNLTGALRYKYLNDNGEEALIEVKDGYPENTDEFSVGDKIYTRPHNLVNYLDFIKFFQSSWLNSLLYYHPEYCYYKKCKDIEPSYVYDNLLLNTQKSSEAMEKGFYNPLGMSYLPTDTLLVGGVPRTINYSALEGGSVVRDPVLTYTFLNTNDLENKLRTIQWNCNPSTTKTFWQLYERERANNGLNAADTCVDDLFWPLLRAHYLQQKREWLNEYYNDSCPTGVICGNGVGGIRIRHFLINSSSQMAWDQVTDNDKNTVDKTLWSSVDACNPDTVERRINSQIISYCRTKCDNNAEMWIQKLADCPTIQALNSTQLADLKEDLAKLCESGCDLDNPYGSITRSPNANTTAFPDANLNDVFTRHLGANWFQKGVCDDLLIDFPGEYGHDYLATDDPDADTCACSTTKEVVANNRCPESGVDSLAINDCACDMTTDLKNDLLSSMDIADDYKCKTCIACDDMQDPVRLFLMKYNPKLEEDSTTYQKLLTTWLNRNFKFNLTYNEYRAYAEECVGAYVDTSWLSVWNIVGIDRTISYNGFDFNNAIFELDSTQMASLYSQWTKDQYSIELTGKDPFRTRPNNPYNFGLYASNENVFTLNRSNFMTTATTGEKLACHCEKILTVAKLLEGPPVSSNTPFSLYNSLFGTPPSCLTPFDDIRNYCSNLWNMMPPSTLGSQAEGFKEGDKFNAIQIDWIDGTYGLIAPDAFMSCLSDAPCDPMPVTDTERDYMDTCACNKLKLMFNQWTAAGGKALTGYEFKEYIFNQVGVNPDNPLDLLDMCDQFIKTDFEKDDEGNTDDWTLGDNFWSPISNENLKKFAKNKNYTVPKSFNCSPTPVTWEPIELPSTPSCIKLMDCNSMKELINEYIANNPLPGGEEKWDDYNANGCTSGDETNSAFDLLNNISGMEREIENRERENFIHSVKFNWSGSSGTSIPPYDETAIEDLRDWKDNFKNWFYDLHKDCDPMPSEVDFETMMGYYSVCKPFCNNTPVPFTSPKCSSCYAVDTPWLKAFVDFNNQVIGVNNFNNVKRIVDSKWLLYSTKSSYSSKLVPTFYDGILYEGLPYKQYLRYNIKKFTYPYLQVEIPDNNGYILNYSMEYLGNQDWVNYSNITKFKNPRGVRQQTCSPFQYFYVDVEQEIDEKYWDNSTLPPGEEKCAECPTSWTAGVPDGCKLTYTILVRVNTKTILNPVSCMSCAKLCNKPLVRPVIVTGDACVEQEMQTAAQNAMLRYNDYLVAQSRYFDSMYSNRCFNAKDTFKIKYKNRQYHYTLYYYDRAGNLCKTVPPEGVDIDNTSMSAAHRQILADYRIANAPLHRADHNQTRVYTYHDLVTNYRYNSLNQLLWENTPDAGAKQMWYDVLGRVVVSQNEKQDNNGNKHSYTQYDNLGRISEAGEVTPVSTGLNMTHEMAATPASLLSFLDVSSNPSYKQQVVRSFYDVAANTTRLAGGFVGGQNNLRNRIASMTFELENDEDATTYDQASNYSYDIYGNVTELVQDVKALDNMNCHLFNIQYDFELLTGLVNQVSYQDGGLDQMHHRYYYDLDNRLTSVQTSRDKYNWETDARYSYYLHGPLGRKELGNLQVQGVDFAYTMQGYIKSVNSGTLDATMDMGRDGSTATFPFGAGINPNQHVARDAFGYYLKYFNSDYHSAGGQKVEPDTMYSSFGSKYRQLFNGNISLMGTALPLMNTYWSGSPDHQTLGNVYHYDQLNRITKHHVFTHLNKSFNQWPYTSTNGSSQYYERFNYDANGNILNLNRNGDLTASNMKMDGLTYHYETEARSVLVNGTTVTWTALIRNQLYHVNDVVADGIYSDDVDDQGTFSSSSISTSNNYTFDEIGNLVQDQQEEIAEIKWNVYGKVESITRTSGSLRPDLEFGYSGDGQRLYKLVKPKDGSGNLKQELEWVYSYYIRDVQGNVMAIYQKTMSETETEDTYNENLKAIEWSVYGSERVGTISEKNTLLSSREFTMFGTPSDGSWADRTYTGSATVNAMTGNEYILTRGNKQFELCNHLGNVLVTVQDRKQSKDNNADNITDYYVAYIKTVTDYYAFGSPIPRLGGAIPECYVTEVEVTETVFDVEEFFESSSLGGFVAGTGSRSVTNPTGSALHINAYWTTRPLAIKAVSLVSGETYTVDFDILGFSVVSGFTHTVRVRVMMSGNIQTFTYTTTGSKSFSFTSSVTGTVNIEVGSVISGSGSYISFPYIDIDNFQMSHVSVTMQPTNVCGTDNIEKYRYGFNTQEKDNEVYGEANSYTAEFWQYDARLGRRWNVDPRPNPSISNYACFGNNPMLFSDILGDTVKFKSTAEEEDYNATKSSLASKIQECQNSVDEFTKKKKDRGWSDEKIRDKLSKKDYYVRLQGYNILSNTFNSLETSTITFKYIHRTNYINKNQYGETSFGEDEKGTPIVLIYFEPGNQSALIHENRHGLGVMNNEVGPGDRTINGYDFNDEYEAYLHEQYWDPVRVDKLVYDYAIENNKNPILFDLWAYIEAIYDKKSDINKTRSQTRPEASPFISR